MKASIPSNERSMDIMKTSIGRSDIIFLYLKSNQINGFHNTSSYTPPKTASVVEYVCKEASICYFSDVVDDLSYSVDVKEISYLPSRDMELALSKKSKIITSTNVRRRIVRVCAYRPQ